MGSLHISTVAGAAVAITLATAAQAVPVTRAANIVNHSFEIGSTAADGQIDFRSVTGWNSFSGGYINPNATQFPGGASDGTYALVSGLHSQTLSEVLVAGRTYTLMIDVGDRFDMATPFWGISFSSGAGLLGSLSQGTSPITDGWTTKTITFVADANTLGLGTALSIRLSTAGGSALFDNVRLNVTEDVVVEPDPVPEPAMFGLLGLGILGLASLRRRR